MMFVRIIFLLGLVFFCNVAQAGLWSLMRGTTPQSSVVFEPIGYHVVDGLQNKSQPNNLNWMTSVNYHSFTAGTFLNSQERQVYFAGIDRQFYGYKKLSFAYMIGIMHGYNGVLEDTLGHALGGDPGLLLAILFRYQLSNHFDFSSSFYGVGLIFGAAYRF